MKRQSIRSLLLLGLAALFSAPAFAQVSLGTSQNFAVLGGSTVTNTGVSAINGEVGVSPGTSVTGFPPGVVTNGTIHLNDAVAMQAQLDLTVAYNAVASTPCNVNLTGQDLGGLTLTPGVYCFTNSAQLTGTLRLDFQGNPNAVFLFQIGSTLTTASGSSVLLLNSGGTTCPANLFFQVGSSATFGTTSSFVGNVLALASITLTTGAQLQGRALARNGAVTLDTNSVTRCGPAIGCPLITVNPPTLPNGTIGGAYNQIVSASGGVAPFTFSVTNGALPNGLTLNPATGAITGTPLTAGSFSFTITARDANGCLGTRSYVIVIAPAGCPVVMVNPSTLPPGILQSPYSQIISGSGGVAPYMFTVTSGTLPNGLVLNGVTGAITGTPLSAGSFGFTITATDANGCPGSRPYVIVISAVACPIITLSPSTLPFPMLGTPFTGTITATGGSAPITFAIASGALPNGLVLNPTSGVISGTPTAFGAFNFTIRATDANGCFGTLAFSGSILPGASPSGIPALGFGGLALLTLLLAGVGLTMVRRSSI